MMVHGDGPKDASIFIVGQRPGFQELKAGRPFVGKSGLELDRYLLTCCGVDRSAVFCTNLVRDFHGEDEIEDWEIERDWPLLLDELGECEPKYLVLLGSYAARKFLGSEFSLEWGNGLVWPTTQGYIVPIIHPAAGLHRQAEAVRVWWGFMQLGRLLHGEQLPQGHLHEINTTNARLCGESYIAGENRSEYWLLDLAKEFCREVSQSASSNARPTERTRHDKCSQVPVRADGSGGPSGDGTSPYLRELLLRESVPLERVDDGTTSGSAQKEVLRQRTRQNPLPLDKGGTEKSLELYDLSQDQTETVSVDTEGTVNEPWSVQVSYGGFSSVVVKHPLPAAYLPSIVGHNLLHDLPVLKAMGIRSGRIQDTMVMAALLGTEPQGLKALARRLVGMKMSEYEDVVSPAKRELALAYLSRVLDMVG